MNHIDLLWNALRSQGIDHKKTRSGWQCCCPAHEDRTPSLSIRVGEDGRSCTVTLVAVSRKSARPWV